MICSCSLLSEQKRARLIILLKLYQDHELCVSFQHEIFYFFIL